MINDEPVVICEKEIRSKRIWLRVKARDLDIWSIKINDKILETNKTRYADIKPLFDAIVNSIALFEGVALCERCGQYRELKKVQVNYVDDDPSGDGKMHYYLALCCDDCVRAANDKEKGTVVYIEDD